MKRRNFLAYGSLLSVGEIVFSDENYDPDGCSTVPKENAAWCATKDRKDNTDTRAIMKNILPENILLPEYADDANSLSVEIPRNYIGTDKLDTFAYSIIGPNGNTVYTMKKRIDGRHRENIEHRLEPVTAEVAVSTDTGYGVQRVFKLDETGLTAKRDEKFTPDTRPEKLGKN